MAVLESLIIDQLLFVILLRLKAPAFDAMK